MKKNIYFVDAIGIHCGMKYYADSFKEVIYDKHNSINVLSNYSDNNKQPFLYNFYKGTLPIKIIKLILSCAKLFIKILKDRNSIYIIFSYGTMVDIMLHLVLLCSKNHIIDVHEVIQQGSENNKKLKIIYSYIYRRTTNVIIHSKRSENILSEIGFNGKSLFVPHFEYSTSTKYNIENINTDVQDLIKKKINILWFGNITYSKGIDLYVKNINNLPEELKSRINFIISGRSLDGVFETCDTDKPYFSVLLKRLNDDEMIYLYTKVDYVVLPYRQTSQSGVLEMAMHYKKPVIVSNIPYFVSIITKYPSFGVITNLDSDSFTKTIRFILQNKKEYYTENDLYNYKHREDFVVFKEKFLDMIYNM